MKGGILKRDSGYIAVTIGLFILVAIFWSQVLIGKAYLEVNCRDMDECMALASQGKQYIPEFEMTDGQRAWLNDVYKKAKERE